jgi:nucleoside 2-deoxyribosyltransferase
MNTLPKVYLAGGLATNWRRSIIDEMGDFFIFFDPQNHGSESCSKEYTNWDLFHVKQCDIIFAYMEKDNQSGYGLTLEIGYAKALDKLIILVDERSSIDTKFSRFFRIVQESASITFDDIEKGKSYLKKFQYKNTLSLAY